VDGAADLRVPALDLAHPLWGHPFHRHTVIAGKASGQNDGAAVCLVTSPLHLVNSVVDLIQLVLGKHPS
jgi:acetyl-CoA acetyltransferase